MYLRNTDLLKRDDPNTVLLQTFAKKAGLINLIGSITRPNVRGGSCIDLIMTDCRFVSHCGVSDVMVADHYTVYAIRKKKKEAKKLVIETVRNYRNFNKDTFCQLLDNIDWNMYNFELNPSVQWCFLYDEVIKILAIMCPYKRVHTRVPRKKWLTGEIFALMRERKCLIKRFKLIKDPSILTDIRKLRNRVNSAIDNAKVHYVKNLLGATRKDPRKFWRNIKSVIEGEDSNIEHVTFKDTISGQDIESNDAPNFVNRFFAEIADRTCDINEARPYVVGNRVNTRFYFLPPEMYEIMLFAEDIDANTSSGVDGINSRICKIMLLHLPDKFCMLCANSLFIGYFPREWTLSRVKLLPKSGDLSNPGNWRPISMTNVFSKLLEKIVYRQVLQYLLENRIIAGSQYGFLPGKSTHEAIFKTVQHIYGALNNNKMLGMLLLDIAKAFNCVDHDTLYKKMDTTGFGPMVIQWFKSYLDRSQQVILNGSLSDITPVSKGIAQGTVLGPILFILYINDIFKCTKYVNMTMFADDCVMYLSGNNWCTIQQRIQTDFDAVVDWTFRNNLRLNYEKTKAMIFSTRHKISKLVNPKHFEMSNHIISFVRNYVYLGVLIDNVMSLVPLMKDLEKRISNKIFMLRKMRKFLTFDAAVLVYKQIILPIIDYAGFLLIACRKEDKNDLQVLQNDILRICTRNRFSDRISIEKLHGKCKLLSLEQRRRKQLLGLMFILSKDKDFLHIPGRLTRNANKVVFKVPTKISPTYERSPYYVGTLLWNELPLATQESNCTFEFKKIIGRMNRKYKNL